MKPRMLVIGTAITLGVAVLYCDRRATHAELEALRGAIPATSTAPPAKQTEVVWRPPQPARGPIEVPTAKVIDPTVESSKLAVRQLAQQKSAKTPIEQFAPIHDTLEAAFVAEPRDGAWAMEARRTADAKLAADLPMTSAIKSIDCRSTMCRIESTHDGYTYARAFVSRLATFERRPWNGAFYTGPIAQDRGSGTVTFVTYLAREGSEMPTIPDHTDEEPAIR